MPELPEVETVVQGLSPIMQEATITDTLKHREDLRIPIPSDLIERTRNTQVTAISRRAKYILIHLNTKDTIIAHLGMSGKMTIHPHYNNHYQKHDHVVFRLDNGKEIIFTDPRRFGLITLSKSDTIDRHPLIQHLGPEPLEKECNEVYFQSVLQQKKLPIKHAIMDNKIIVGVGNIYACESLFLSGIHPERPANTLSTTEIKHLTQAIKQVLTAAIASGGSTLRDYVRSDGDLGYFQHQFNVYGKEGLPCAKCENEVQKIRQGGRSTCYCPICQK